MRATSKLKSRALLLLLLFACCDPCRGEEPWLAFPNEDLRFQIVTDAPDSPVIGSALFGQGYNGSWGLPTYTVDSSSDRIVTGFGQTFVVPQAGTLQEARLQLSRYNDPVPTGGNFEVAVSEFDPTSGLRLETLASQKASSTIIDADLGSTGYIARFDFADRGITLNPNTTYLLSVKWPDDFQILVTHGPNFTVYGSPETYPGGNVVYLPGPDFSQIPEPTLACFLTGVLACLALSRRAKLR